jgi:hypothetical protein
VLVSFGGHVYELISDVRAYASAEAYAAILYHPSTGETTTGHLAVINSKAENQFLHSFIQSQQLSSVWVGGREVSGGRWAWDTTHHTFQNVFYSTRGSFSYSPWLSTPAPNTNQGLCLAMTGSNGEANSWVASQCTNAMAAIIEYGMPHVCASFNSVPVRASCMYIVESGRGVVRMSLRICL